MDNPIASDNVSRDVSARTAMIVMAIITVLALILRLYRISAESVWWDEHTSVMYLGAPSLWSFLKSNRTLDPATFPLYYVLEYLWFHWVSTSIVGLRVLSVLLGLAGLPLLYMLGRALFSRAAGIIAALLLALSPIHIFHAQGIRMYVLFNLLAIASMLTFVYLLRDWRKRWWVAHFAVNALLLWTHPFAGLVLAAQGVYLLIFHFRYPKRILAWGGLNSSVVLSLVVYVASARFWSAESTTNWLRLPSPVELIGDLFGDDAIGLTYQLRISEHAWACLPGGMARFFVSIHYIFDATLLIFFAGSVLLSFRSIFAGITDANGRSRRTIEANVLLLLWAILPVVALYVLSRCFRPCMFPRYTSHCSFALYLIIGGLISSLLDKRLIAVCVSLLLSLYCYQLSLSLPGPQRTDWRTAAEMVKADEAPGDLTLIYSFDVALAEASQQMFLRYRDGAPSLAAHAKSLPVLAEDALFYISERRAMHGEATVWAVIALNAFDSGPCAAFENELQTRGLTFSSRELSGVEHIMIYKISADKEPIHSAPAIEQNEEYIDAFGDLGLSLAENDMPVIALNALRKIPASNSSAIRPYENVIAALESHAPSADKTKAARMFLLGTGFRKNGNLSFAAEQFKNASEADSDLSVARHWLGITLIESGRYEDALPIMRKIVQLDISDSIVYSHLVRVIEKNGNAAGALESINMLMKAIGLLDSGEQRAALEMTHDAARRDPEYGTPRFLMGALELEANDATSGLNDIRASLKLEPVLNDLTGPFITALFDSKDYDKAWAEIERMKSTGFEMPDAFINKLRKDSGREH